MPPAGNPTVLLGPGFQFDPGNNLPGYYIGHAIPTAGNPTALLDPGFQFDPGKKLPGYYIGHA